MRVQVRALLLLLAASVGIAGNRGPTAWYVRGSEGATRPIQALRGGSAKKETGVGFTDRQRDGLEGKGNEALAAADHVDAALNKRRLEAAKKKFKELSEKGAERAAQGRSGGVKGAIVNGTVTNASLLSQGGFKKENRKGCHPDHVAVRDGGRCVIGEARVVLITSVLRAGCVRMSQTKIQRTCGAVARAKRSRSAASNLSLVQTQCTDGAPRCVRARDYTAALTFARPRRRPIEAPPPPAPG